MRLTCISCEVTLDKTRRQAHAGCCQPCANARYAFPLRKKAHRAVTNAVKRGALPRAKLLTCVDCGRQAHDYDHRYYAKPLDVVPVCRSCNQKRGPAIDSLYLRSPQAAQAQG